MANRPGISEIVVNGQKILTRIEEMNIWGLEFWKDNPRVNAVIKQKHADNEISNDDIDQALWEKDSVKDLKKDIEKHGGLIDEILVKGNTVLEGNSRLCSYRHLYKNAEKRNDEEEMLKWSYIRARVIPDNTTNDVLFSLLGTWHIKGKTQWDTYEKAAYLKRMYEVHGYSYKEIADTISQTEKFVKDHIDAYEMMIINNVFTLEKFSYFFELVKNKKLKEIAEKDETVIPNTIQAIKDGQFKRGEEIRDLHKVIKDKKANKEFFVGKANFNDALETTKERHPEYKDSFYNHMKKMTELLENCSIEDIDKLKDSGDKQYIVNKFYRACMSFYKKTGLKT